MSSKKQLTKQQALIEKKKKEYLEYYKDVPVYKYAAAYIGKNEDTVLIWRKKDAGFSDKMQRLKAEFLRKKLCKGVSNTFIIERLFREFSPRQELTGKDGKDLPTPIYNGKSSEEKV